MNEICLNCRFYGGARGPEEIESPVDPREDTNTEFWGDCRRFPQKVEKFCNDWCGEFKSVTDEAKA